MVDDSAARVASAIRKQALRSAAGERLPSTRCLVERHRVSPVTVQRALRALVSEGIVETRAGEGTFVARRLVVGAGDVAWQTSALGAPVADVGPLLELVTPRPLEANSLSAGYLPSDLQPTALLVKAMTRAQRRPGAWGTVPVSGLPELREWFAREVANGGNAGDVVIAQGGQAALTSVLRAVCEPGSAVVVESPTYLGAIAAARAGGLRIVPIAGRWDGPDPDELDDRLASSDASAFYAQPTIANPSGATWSATRRAEVLDVIRRHGVFLIEDNWAHDLVIDGTPPRAVAEADTDGHVLQIRTLTKAAAPSLRIAAVVGRGPAIRRLQSARVIDDLFVSGVLQLAALELVTHSSWERHLRGLRAALAERRTALAAAVRAELGDDALVGWPIGGFHLWVRLPESNGLTADGLTERARLSGVIITSGTQCFPGEPTGQYVRMTFAASPPAQLREGVRRIAALL